MVEFGVTACNKVAIADGLLDSNPLFLTGNTDTVYVSAILDLERDGPTVIEVPPGCGPTTVNDAWFRFITDLGKPGPDRGQGGTYLIVPEGYDGPRPDGWFVSESPSRIHWLIFRGLLVDGKPEAPTQLFHEGLKVYPLSQADDPPAMEFISMTGKQFNTIHANDVTFFEELDAVIQREPLGGDRRRDPGPPVRHRDQEGHALRPGRAHEGPPHRGDQGRQRHGPGHLVQDPRPRGDEVPRPSLEDRVHRQRLPVAGGRRGRRPRRRRSDAVLLPGHREHAGHGPAHPRCRLAVRLHRARQRRGVPRRRPVVLDARPGRRPRQGLLVDRGSTTRRPAPSSRPASRTPASTTPGTR